MRSEIKKISTGELESEGNLLSETQNPHVNVLEGVVDLMTMAQ